MARKKTKTKAKLNVPTPGAFRWAIPAKAERLISPANMKRFRDSLVAVSQGKIGGVAYYPLPKTPPEKAVAFFVASGPLAHKFARWNRRVR